MSINRSLARERGLDETTIKLIEGIQDHISSIIEESQPPFNQHCYETIEYFENMLQHLWGFDVDETMHTWKHKYSFKMMWAGRKWRCLTTNEVFIVPPDVKPTDFYSWGEAFLDVGRDGGYYRVSNCEEIL